MSEKKGYRRGWHHTKTRGSETTVNCSFCGRVVPKYKSFSVIKGLRISDLLLRKELGHKISMMQTKMYACPSCARHRNIVRKKR